MTSQTTFYLSQVLGKKFVSLQGEDLGKIKDFYVDLTVWSGREHEHLRPKVIAVKVKTYQREAVYDFTSFEIKRFKRNLCIICHEVNEMSASGHPNRLWLVENILDKQIVEQRRGSGAPGAAVGGGCFQRRRGRQGREGSAEDRRLHPRSAQ